jgi:hypothetical protein
VQLHAVVVTVAVLHAVVVTVAVLHAVVVTVAVLHAVVVTVAVLHVMVVTVAVLHVMVVTVAVATMGAAVTDPHGWTGSMLSGTMDLASGAALVLFRLPMVSAFNKS